VKFEGRVAVATAGLGKCPDCCIVGWNSLLRPGGVIPGDVLNESAAETAPCADG